MPTQNITPVQTINPTKLDDYQLCPQKYKFKHIDGQKEPMSHPLAFGTAAHRVLQILHEAPDCRRVDIGETLRKALTSALFTHEEIDSYVMRGSAALQHYRTEHLQNSSDKTIGAEMSLNFLFIHEGVRVRLNCRVDRIFVNGDGVLHAVDFKFSFAGRIPTPESLHTSLRAFLCHVLVRKRFPQYERIKVGFLNVPTNTSSWIEFPPEERNLNRAELWREVQRIFAKDFSPKISENCNWCAFRDFCPAVNQLISFDDI